MDIISQGKVVSLAFVLTADGDVVARTEDSGPLEYLHGAGNIPPGLENQLEGKTIGDQLQVTLAADEAYGTYNEEDVEEIDRVDVEDADELEIGMIVEVEDEEGYTHTATVVQITDETVMLDFNHPLAGKTLLYDVEVLGVRDAEEDELAHGHPHSLNVFEYGDDEDDEDYDEDDDEDEYEYDEYDEYGKKD